MRRRILEGNDEDDEDDDADDESQSSQMEESEINYQSAGVGLQQPFPPTTQSLHNIHRLRHSNQQFADEHTGHHQIASACSKLSLRNSSQSDSSATVLPSNSNDGIKLSPAYNMLVQNHNNRR